MWVSPTFQQDVGGLGIGSNTVWPATAAGAVRFAWAIPNDLQTFQAAKVVLIPHGPGGAATLNLVVCQAQSGSLVLSGCAPLATQAFNGVTNQLLEVDVSGSIAPKIGVPGANYLAVLAYTTPSTSTVRGDASASTGSIFGGYFRSASNAGTGLLGWAPSVTGTTYGVRGESDSSAGTGIFGWAAAADAASSHTFGVKGQSETVNSGIGVAGIATDGGKSVATVPLNNPVGVLGVVPDTSPNGFGVVSIGNTKVFGNSQVTGFVSADQVHVESMVILSNIVNGFLPACGPANTRENEGRMILTFGGAGQNSSLYVCREKADNSFEWKQVF